MGEEQRKYAMNNVGKHLKGSYDGWCGVKYYLCYVCVDLMYFTPCLYKGTDQLKSS